MAPIELPAMTSGTPSQDFGNWPTSSRQAFGRFFQIGVDHQRFLFLDYLRGHAFAQWKRRNSHLLAMIAAIWEFNLIGTAIEEGYREAQIGPHWSEITSCRALYNCSGSVSAVTA